VILLLAISLSILAVPASASDVSMTVQNEQMQVNMVLSLHQNMTVFPNQTGPLSPAQLTNASSAIAQALRKTSPAANLSGLALKLNSTNDWLNVTVTMSVSGISERHGDILAVNTTWKAFNVSSDLRMGNLSYNTVGSRYLRPAVDFYVNASKFENEPNATIKAVNFFVNQTQSVAPEEAANSAGNFTIFDFKPLDVPLEQWNRTYNVQNNTTTWQYVPLSEVGVFVKAQELNQSLEIFSDFLSYTAEIGVPGLARAQGNVLSIDVGSGQKEWVMSGIVIVAIVVAVASQLLFRTRRKAVRLKRR
jgi:opacity protein-like surface antigen